MSPCGNVGNTVGIRIAYYAIRQPEAPAGTISPDLPDFVPIPAGKESYDPAGSMVRAGSQGGRNDHVRNSVAVTVQSPRDLLRIPTDSSRIHSPLDFPSAPAGYQDHWFGSGGLILEMIARCGQVRDSVVVDVAEGCNG